MSVKCFGIQTEIAEEMKKRLCEVICVAPWIALDLRCLVSCVWSANKVKCIYICIKAGMNLGEEGAAVISEALKTNCALTMLDLYDTKSAIEGARLITEGLKKNDTLTELNLGGDE